MTRASHAIDLGSDHKSLRMKIMLQKNTRTSCGKKHTKKTTIPAWPPKDVSLYTSVLDDQMSNISLMSTLADKCEQVQEAIKQAMELSKQAQHETDAEPPSLLQHAKGLQPAKRLKGR